jgi:hypothetical protein
MEALMNAFNPPDQWSRPPQPPGRTKEQKTKKLVIIIFIITAIAMPYLALFTAFVWAVWWWLTKRSSSA